MALSAVAFARVQSSVYQVRQSTALYTTDATFMCRGQAHADAPLGVTRRARQPIGRLHELVPG